MNRELWKQTANESWVPHWTCPSCATGQLRLLDKPIPVHMSSTTRSSLHDESFFQGDAEERFACMLFCTNPQCAEAVSVSGVTGFEEVPDGEGGFEWSRYLIPLFFLPPPRMIEIPAKCPAKIKSELRSAFMLYWCHLGASANRIRNVLELLLTELGVKRFEVQKNQRRRMSLNVRIALFKGKDPELADVMLAVKWLGNEGSHPGSLKKNDLLDALEMVEHVLHDVYVRAASPVREIARQINRARGPRRTR
jgi:hypothetical protein